MTGPEELRRRRSAAQWLGQRPAAPPTEVVARLVGVQAQDPPAARLAVRARSTAATADTVRAAAERGEVVSSWLMRGALHLVAAEELRWLLQMFGARNAKAGARRRRELGLDDDTCARALRAIERALGGGPLSRADLIARVIEAGVAVNPQGQAPAHLMAYAASQGLICRGPELAGGEPGYVLLGYRGRDLALDPRHAKRIQASGGLIHPAVLVDGRVVGAWRLRRAGGRATLEVEPFEPLDTGLQPQLRAEAADIGRFLGIEVTLAG